MKRTLQQTDSFNSSGATIVPDVRSSNPRASGENSRMLSSQDSVGREFDAVLSAGDQGMIRLLQGQQKNEGWDYMRGYSQVISSQENSTPFSSQPAPLTESGSFAFDLPPPTLLSHDPSPPSASVSPDPPAPSTSPSNLHTIPLDPHSPYVQPNVELYRPVSSSSWHTEQSGSEFSYSATDVSEDHEMPLVSHTELPDLGFDAMALGGGPGMGQAQANWNNYEAARQSLEAFATARPVDSPARGLNGGVGPIRGPGGVEETESQRKARLEHRRSINRKSAQKHRLRRKEELEDLNKTIMERDAKIAQLEKELAVERARVAQVLAFLKEHTGLNPSAPAAAAALGVGAGAGGPGLPSPPAEPPLGLEKDKKQKEGRRKSMRAKEDK